MKSSVKITANPKTGEVFTPNAELSKKDGKQYGFIRLEQTVVDMSTGVARVKTISALKSFLKEDYLKAKDFLTAGRELPGTILRLESLVEAQGFSPKMAGSEENAQPCTLDGKQIYQSTQYSTDVNAVDVLIAHNNKIEGSNKAVKAGEALNAKQGH